MLRGGEGDAALLGTQKGFLKNKLGGVLSRTCVDVTQCVLLTTRYSYQDPIILANASDPRRYPYRI